MKTNKTFESWYTMIMEGELATATTATTTTEAPTISNDVDTIMTSLETLAKELTEELEGEDFTEVNEADAEGPSIVMQWMWWMPKARKAQAKVNKIKLNITDMEAAASDAPDAQQKAKIAAKAKQAKEQAVELQKMVDDKFKSKGDLVSKAIHNEKIAGQIASIKRASGLEDDPEKLSTYKEKMAELQQKYKEDQEAIKELEPSDDDKKKAAEKAKEEKAAQDKLEADAKAAKDKEDGKEPKEPADPKEPKEPADPKEPKEPADPNEPKEPADPKEPKEPADPKVKELQDDITAKEGELADAEKSPDKNKEGIDVLKGAIAGMKKKLEALKQKSAPQESLVTRAKAAGLNELATEIESKFDWQVSEGTALHSKYNELIKKTEYSNTLNESKYENLSVKERFSRLM